MCLLHSLNQSAGLISAIATVVLAVLTYQLVQWTGASVAATQALKEIERKRDAAEDPLVYLFFEQYLANNGGAMFILQNSGRRSLFLRSLKVVVPNDSVANIRGLDCSSLKTKWQGDDGELLNIVISPDEPLRITFMPRTSSGQGFEVLFQLYTGDPVRMRIDPSILNGYVLRAPGSSSLEIEARAFQD